MQTIVANPPYFVIRPNSCLNATNAVEFQRQVTTAVAQERHNIVVVDLEQVESLDSAGLMALVYSLRLAQALDRRFSICSVSPSIRIIFELTQLDKVFEMFESVASLEAKLA